jgi:hypothetical protein
VLGPASTNFNDYVGTVATNDADVVMDRPSVYELAHIDRDRYTIVVVDLIVDGPTTATIYAFDRIEDGISRLAEIVELGRCRGEVPQSRHSPHLRPVPVRLRQRRQRGRGKAVVRNLCGAHRRQTIVPSGDSQPEPLDRGQGRHKEFRAGPAADYSGEMDYTVPPAVVKAAYWHEVAETALAFVKRFNRLM